MTTQHAVFVLNTLTNFSLSSLNILFESHPLSCFNFSKGLPFTSFFFSDLGSTGWAEGYTPLDFELLCPDGTRAAVTEWAGCNLGPIPPSAVMTRPVTVTKISDFLLQSQV